MGFSRAYMPPCGNDKSDKGIVDLHVTWKIVYFDGLPGCVAHDFYSIHTKRRWLI